MADLNTVALSGNLVGDPELRSTPSGKNVAQLRLGTQLGKDKSMFTDVTVWGGQSASFDLAETVVNAFQKGDRIQLTGRLGYDEWEKDGTKRSKHVVIAQDIVLPPRDAAPASAPSDDVDF